MKNSIIAVFLGLLLMSTTSVLAADLVGQSYIERLSVGGNVTIKQVAESIYGTGMQDPEVLDVVAEILLDKYSEASNNDIDTLSWLCRALGASGNPRYANVLTEIVDSKAHRKLKKHAKNALKEVGSASGEQYTKGLVNLDVLRNATQEKLASAAESGETGTLEIIRVGMTLQEVQSFVGPPTATSSHQTGKAWNPFNFGQKDLARTSYHYKGQGQIIFSHDGYSSVSRVLEVILDPNETGYP